MFAYRLAQLLALLSLVWAGAVGSVQAGAGADAFFDAGFGEFKTELETARAEGKQGVLLVFEAADCPYCRLMRATVLNREDVQAYYRRHFRVFTVDVLGALAVEDFDGRKLREKELAAAYQVRGTPTFVFVDLSGRTTGRHTGALRQASDFLALGRYIAEGHYRGTSFEQYRRQQN